MFAMMVAIAIGQAAAQAQPPVTDARQLRTAAPRALAKIETTRAQGTPVGLAWRSDGVLYLRVTRGKDKDGKDGVRHYQIATAPTISVGQTDGAPQWAASYWIWKSSLTAPGDPALKIDVEQRKERQRSINTPGAAGLAGINSSGYVGDGGDIGGSASEAAFAASSGQMAGIVTLRFKGEVVGEWTNEIPALGVQFGWAPAPMGMLAYADGEKRQLAILDREGHKLTVPDTSNVLLPAWSPDGSRLVFLEKKSAEIYQLMVVDLR